MRVRAFFLLSLCSVVLLLATSARAERWEIVEGEKGNQVVFYSKATMESFEGKTDRVRGWIELDASPNGISAFWSVEVDLASLDTGIGLRNTHMRENHLQTDEFPVARFESSESPTAIDGGLLDAEEWEFLLEGELTLHGVTQERIIPIHASRGEDGVLLVQAEFTISLADHEIPLPKFLMMKLADTQRIEVNFRALPRSEVAE